MRSTIYFGHADGALNDRNYLYPALIPAPYDSEQLRALLNLHLLLYQELVVPDNHLLHNIVLRDLLVDRYDNPRPHSRFLSDGAIVVTQRSTVGKSFLDLEAQLRERGAYGHPGLDSLRGFAEFLQSAARNRLTYQEEQYAGNLQTLFQSRLAELSLAERPSVDPVADVVLAALARLPPSDYRRALRGRTWFFALADEVQGRNPALAQRIRLWSSAMAQYAAAMSLELDPAYPLPLSADVQKLHEVRPISDGFRETADSLLRSRFTIGPEELASLSPDVIAEIRQGRPFKRFVAASAAIGEEKDPVKAASDLSRSLNSYLTELQDILALDVTGARARYVTRKRTADLAAVAFFTGGLASSGVGLAVPITGSASTAFNVAAIAWSLVGAALPHWLASRATDTVMSARSKLALGPGYRRNGVIQVGGQVS